MGMITNGPGAMALGPADRAAAVAAVKARLRVASSDEEPLIAAFAETALGLAERFTGQVLVRRAMTQALSGGAEWQRLGARPVRTIGAVSGADGTMLPLASYAVDIDPDGLGWVRVGGRAAAGFEAGLADSWDALPAGLREGAAMLAAHLFDDRAGDAPVPSAVTALWRPFRVMRLAAESRS